MSIQAMAERSVLLAQARSDRAVPAEAFDGTAEQTPAPPKLSGLEALRTYIPAEVMGCYVPLLALIPADSRTDSYQWIRIGLFLLGIVLTFIWTFRSFAAKLKKMNVHRTKGLRGWPWWALGSSFFAFGVWGAFVPASFLTGQPGYQGWQGTLAIMVAAAILAGVGALGSELGWA